MLQDIKKILYHESTILSRLDELASEITEDYRGRDLTVVAVLNGSLVFMADLLRRIPIHLQLDCLSVASYNGTRSAGQINFRKGQFRDVRNRHILILDDILDTGATLKAIRKHIAAESGALSIKICVLLRKKLDIPKIVDADYVGLIFRTNSWLVTGSTTTNDIGTCPSSASSQMRQSAATSLGIFRPDRPGGKLKELHPSGDREER
jgi:hypoxanthine phosphoribosyltransferase